MARKKSATIDLKLRMKEPLRAKIEKAAKAKGISMNAEMVEQLDLAYGPSNIIAKIFDGEPMLPRLMSMSVLRSAEEVSGKPWWEDRDTTKDLIRRTAMYTVMNLADGPYPDEWDDYPEQAKENARDAYAILIELGDQAAKDLRNLDANNRKRPKGRK